MNFNPRSILGTLAAALLLTLGSTDEARAACDVGGLAPGTQVAELQTVAGSICIELFSDDAPLHVANFLYYLNNGLMVDTFFHRSVPGFIIQGGGFRIGASDFEVIPPDNGTVTNEPCTLDIPSPPPGDPGIMVCSERGNERGTIALAKLELLPDSGTTNWFINTADNRENLDNQNGGFTVFGRVLDMTAVDAIEAMHATTADEAFWLESAVLGTGFAAALQQPPIFTPYGCFDPADQVTVLDHTVLPGLAALPDPEIPGMFFTLSAGCGTVTTVATFTADPGPPECPDLDAIGIRTTGPANPVNFTVTPDPYIEFTCEQKTEALAQRNNWQPDYVNHMLANVVPLDVVTVPEPASWLVFPAGLSMLALLRRRRLR